MRVSRVQTLLDASGGWLLAALHFVLGLRVLLDPRVMHDEGQAMFGFSRSLSESFFACLYFQKVKPAAALFYALPARLGFVPYLVVHLAVSALAVQLLFRVAQSMGQRRPWLPALVLALSPMFAWNAATGISNADAVAGIVAFLYLVEVRKAPLLAGVVLGALPWVRFESVVFCACVAPLFLRRDRRVLFGMFAWPVFYAVTGAIYHHNLLWLVRLQPSAPGLQAWNAPEAAMFARHTAQTAIESLVCVSPALIALLFVRWRKLVAMEKASFVFTLVYSGLYVATHFRVLPIGPLFLVGFAQRHAGLMTATAALLVGRAVETIEDERDLDARPFFLLASAIALGAYARVADAGPAVLVGAAALSLCVAAARARSFVALPMAALVALGPTFADGPMTREGYSRTALLTQRPVEHMVLALEGLDPATRGSVVYTNQHLLHPYLERAGRLPGLKVVFVLGLDMTHEMTDHTNPNNGQRAAVLRAVPTATFGDAVAVADFRPDRVPTGALIAFIDDPRNVQLLPPEVWSTHLRELGVERGIRFMQVQ